MTCTSGSVQKVADNTIAAKNQIEKLQAMILDQDASNKTSFFDEIGKHLMDANIKDAREIGYNRDIKTEYTSEFSLDKIARVVIAALKALKEAKDPTAVIPVMSDGAISAYTDLVNAVAEAAKSSSKASDSLSFSMNRLSPGIFVFLYSSSVNIKDEDTFGSETVTSTAIYYRIMQSIDDIRSEAEFGAALIDAKNYRDMKTLQAALTDDLKNGKIDIDEWNKKDDLYFTAVKKIKARLDTYQLKPKREALESLAHKQKDSALLRSKTNQQLVTDAIKELHGKGPAYEKIVKTLEARIENNFYHVGLNFS